MARELDADRLIRTIGLLKYDSDLLAEYLAQAQARVLELEAELAQIKGKTDERAAETVQ